MLFTSYAKNPEKMPANLWFKLCKHGRYFGYGQAELEFAVRDQLLEKL